MGDFPQREVDSNRSLQIMQYLRSENNENHPESWESIVDSVVDIATNRLLNGNERPGQDQDPWQNLFTREIGEYLDGLMPLLDYSNLEDVRVVLTDSQFDKYIHNNPLEILNENCVICMGHETFELGVSELPCGHLFHSKCIEKWLKNYAVTCPSCRKDVRECE